MFKSVQVVGMGRVGKTIVSRLAERGLDVRGPAPEIVLLCVPDRAIAETARTIDPGPWVAHVSGGTPLSALEPHVRRFGMHPLQTFTTWRGAEQLDGAWAAVTSESDEAAAYGTWLAETLGLRPFLLDEGSRALYHAGAVVASNYLVTLHRAAGALFEAAGAPSEALEPLMRRVVENDFELTGPIERGDWETVELHLDALRSGCPQLEPLYRSLADATVTVAEEVRA